MDNNFGYNGVNCICLACGRSQKSSNNKWGPEAKKTYRLYYVTEGRGMITVDDINFFVTAGQSFLTFPSSTVKAEPDKNDAWSFKWVEFRGLEAAWLISQTVFSKKHPVVDKIPVPDFEEYFDVFESNYNSMYARCRAGAKIIILLSYYLEYFPCITTASNNYAIMARDYIEKNYRNPEFSVKSVADYVKIDRTYLYRLFKEETGESVIDYINNRRISRAEAMLADENISIKDIAYSVGFSDQMYFSRVFKKLKGKTPTEFRKENSVNSDNSFIN